MHFGNGCFGEPAGYAKPNAIRCARQSNGRRVSAISLLAVSSGGCFPAMIAATISGARNVRRTIRVAYEGAIPSSRAISSRVGAPGLNNRLPIFRARRSSLTRLASAGAEALGPSTTNFISIPARFSRAGMLSLMERISARSAAGVDARLPSLISAPPYSFKSDANQRRRVDFEVDAIGLQPEFERGQIASAHTAFPSGYFRIERRARPPRPSAFSASEHRIRRQRSRSEFRWGRRTATAIGLRPPLPDSAREFADHEADSTPRFHRLP